MKQNSTDEVKTYYVYDDKGQLRYVLPPIAGDSLTASGVIPDDNGVLKRYAYLYQYDERGNNVVKRLPGCDSICMVYDKADRLVLSQDGNQRLKNKWTVTKYDLLGRVLYTGLLTGTSTQNRVYYKAILDNQVITETYDPTSTFYNTGYTCSNPLTGVTPLTVNYYDNYAFTSLAVNGDSLNWVTPRTGYDTQYGNAKGLLTGTRTYILEQPNNYLSTAMYYDDRGQVVQTRATNQLGGYDKTYNHYDFTGRVKNTRKEHNIANRTVVPEVYTYAYDLAGRLDTTTYQYNNGTPVILSINKYDELGRLSTKYRHNKTDTLTYGYNIRNWITFTKNGAFKENLYYITNLPTGATAYYNGNIAASSWTYNGTTYTYPYVYDQLNRLTGASGGSCGGNFEYFSYDKQGNIKTLQRFKGYSPIDFLTLTYNGNQVKSVTDQYGSQNVYATKEYNDKSNAGNEQSYDLNGNMIKDLDRDILTIRYNVLNLPDTIQFKNGNRIDNLYSAGGQKLKTEYATFNTTLTAPITEGTIFSFYYGNVLKSATGYVGNFEYNSTTTWDANTLLRVHNPEGYYTSYNSYTYYRKDHLGNIREVWQANKNRTIQRTEYYPSGLPWAEGFVPGEQPYKYNGKEFVEMSGYDTYDYGARGYYPAMGRFMTVDPLAEKYYSISPYAYCAGNPVRFIDPDGRGLWDEIKKTASTRINQTKDYVKQEIKQVVKQTIKDVNTVAKIVTGNSTPLISVTATTTASNTTTILKTGLGDKITSDHPVSTTIGKANGLLNLDVKTSTGGDKTATISTASGSSVSVSSNRTVGIGQKVGNSETHVSYGPGVGLGEYNWGSSHTSNGITTGQDYNVRPGGGAAIGGVLIIGTIVTDGASAPLDAAALRLITQ